MNEISEQAKASTIAMILLALNMDPISKDAVARYVQSAINEATAEKDKEIARLKRVTEAALEEVNTTWPDHECDEESCFVCAFRRALEQKGES